jgi:hypothetical protein
LVISTLDDTRKPVAKSTGSTRGSALATIRATGRPAAPRRLERRGAEPVKRRADLALDENRQATDRLQLTGTFEAVAARIEACSLRRVTMVATSAGGCARHRFAAAAITAWHLASNRSVAAIAGLMFDKEYPEPEL